MRMSDIQLMLNVPVEDPYPTKTSIIDGLDKDNFWDLSIEDEIDKNLSKIKRIIDSQK